MQIVALAAQHRVPALYFERDFAEAGGLMSYGANIPEQYRQLGNYAGRILSGQKPGDLPVSRATRLQFVINLKTATALGLAIPPGLFNALCSSSYRSGLRGHRGQRRSDPGRWCRID